MNKNVLRNLSYGVYVVTSKDDDRNVGCVASNLKSNDGCGKYKS